MKLKIFSFLVVSLFSYSSFAQDYHIVTNPNNSISTVITKPDVRSRFVGHLPVYDGPMASGDSCAGTGSERHDSLKHDNGYLYFLDSVRFVIKATPSSFPWQYTKVCVGWTDVGTVNNITYYIVLYDIAGSVPGNLLYVSPPQSATLIPTYPAYSWYSSTVAMPVVNQDAYIGIRWDYNTAGTIYLSADESTTTPLWPGYMATANSPPGWAPIQTYGGYFPNYKCMAIRSQGNSPLPPLCEQFEEGTFPPTGWSVTFSGTNYWLYANVSGYGVGSHSAEYNMYTAAAGTNQTLQTNTFLASDTLTNRDLIFDIAYAPYPATPPYFQDSLVVLASTDGGTTFASLVRLGPTDMQTASATSSPFVPTASQWEHRNYVLPYGTNRIQFLGKSAFGNNAYIDSVCTEANLLGLVQTHTGVPATYSLQQNYPNPFNPSTNIKFELPKAGIVKLIVYDVLGKEVKTLLNEYKQPGEFNVKFDAENLASGVYFYRIEASDFTATKKMLLIK